VRYAQARLEEAATAFERAASLKPSLVDAARNAQLIRQHMAQKRGA
jgi:hypothetical protein